MLKNGAAREKAQWTARADNVIAVIVGLISCYILYLAYGLGASLDLAGAAPVVTQPEIFVGQVDGMTQMFNIDAVSSANKQLTYAPNSRSLKNAALSVITPGDDIVITGWALDSRTGAPVKAVIADLSGTLAIVRPSIPRPMWSLRCIFPHLPWNAAFRLLCRRATSASVRILFDCT